MAEHYSEQDLSDAWAFAAWKHVNAVDSHSKELAIEQFQPNQMVCLADIMTDSHAVRSIKLTGTSSPPHLHRWHGCPSMLYVL